MVLRPALSIFQATYRAIQRFKDDEWAEMWPSVRWELMAMVAIRPLIFARLGRPWLTKVGLTDASYLGAGILESEATLTELRKEARLTAPKGWFADAALEESDSEEDAASLFIDDDLVQGGPPEELKVMAPLPASTEIYRVAHLFAGFRRPGDLEDHLTAQGQTAGMLVQVDSIDKVIDDAHDLLDRKKKDALCERALKGQYQSAMAGPPCGTFARARHNRKCPGSGRPGTRPPRTWS